MAVRNCDPAYRGYVCIALFLSVYQAELNGPAVLHDTTNNLLSPYVQKDSGVSFGSLRFPAPLEQSFRKLYSKAGVLRARLMPGFALIMTTLTCIMRMLGDDEWAFEAVFLLAVFVPLLLITLYTSTKADIYKTYQGFLALSGLLSGLVVSSLYFRPSLAGMPSYFSMEVTWILGVWLILGLRFQMALAVTTLLTLVHIGGSYYLDYSSQVQGYEIVMLFLVNCIGALSCYQLEYTTRLSYAESLELEELTKEFKGLAEVDGLTGLNNRRAYDSYIDRLWSQCKREQMAIVIAMIDVDQFKPYNDQYGHQCGDEALIAVASVIAEHTNRPLDFCARYGGEEFVMALYGPHEEPGHTSPEESVHKYFEALRMAVMDLRIEHDGSMTNKCLSVSIGVSIVYPGCTQRSLDGAVQMADEALYMAKERGRNRVVLSADDDDFSTGVFRSVNNPAA